MSTFTCAACGGFQYQKEEFQLPCGIVCEECYRNNIALCAPNYGIKKPGLHEVLVSIFKEEFDYGGCTFQQWIDINGGTEEAAERAVIGFLLPVWKLHYQRITGEPWQ